MTSLAGNLPKGEGNGLEVLAEALLAEPWRVHAVVCLVDCRSTKVDHDTGEQVPTARIRRIEVVLPGDRKQAQRMLERALEERTGQTVLPYDLEQDVLSAFQGVAPDRGRDDDDEDES